MKQGRIVKVTIISIVAVVATTTFGQSSIALAQTPKAASVEQGSVQPTSAPETPGNFRLVDRTNNKLHLNWDWVAGGVGSIHYELAYAGRTLVLSQYYPGYQLDVSDLDLSTGHRYIINLWAVDSTGNRSPAPAQLTFETTPPTAPSSLTQLSTRDGYPDGISFVFSNDNNGAIRHYEVFLNNQPWGIVSASSNQFSLFRVVSEAYKDPPRGAATLQLRAYDQSLNPSRLSSPLTVTFP